MPFCSSSSKAIPQQLLLLSPLYSQTACAKKLSFFSLPASHFTFSQSVSYFSSTLSSTFPHSWVFIYRALPLSPGRSWLFLVCRCAYSDWTLYCRSFYWTACQWDPPDRREKSYYWRYFPGRVWPTYSSRSLSQLRCSSACWWTQDPWGSIVHLST